MNKRSYSAVRFGLPLLILVGATVFFIIRTAFLIISAPEDDGTPDGTTFTLVTVRSQRGEIYDRNGNILVKNKYTYDVTLDKNAFPSSNTGMNESLAALTGCVPYAGDDLLPLKRDGESYLFEYDEDTVRRKRAELEKMLDKYSLPRDIDAQSLAEALIDRYGLLDEEGKPLFDGETSDSVMRLRYELDRIDFNPFEPFVYASDVPFDTVVKVSEKSVEGVAIRKVAGREYVYPEYMAHILGRVGKIPADEFDYYDELGYPMDANVGVEGVEKAFESYLGGRDGKLVLVRDENGRVIDRYYKEAPVAGKDVYLTLDLSLQMAAEDSLSNNIRYIKNTADEKIAAAKARYTGENGELVPWAVIPSRIGEDCRAGGATAIDPNTGEVFALASYPTYDISSFLDDYTSLASDPDRPLVNRALMGTYEPGSTFKVGVAATALQTGLISANDTIYDRGVYRYYSDFQPRCWIYTSYGYTHGYVNVTSAIQNSCNYFFYDVGRRLTIQRMNEYSKKFGLGQPTGIELPESTGVLAGPEYSASEGKTWMPGDTLQAAIGQSDNLFTPLQLSTYLSTVLNGGTRYASHILYKVCEFGTGEHVYEYSPSVVSEVEINEEHVATLKNAMRRVTENGTASPVFSRYPIEIGGKTGTAQVGQGTSNNGIFIVFAPYDTPEIVVSCVIEHAGGANDVASTIKGILNERFGVNG